MHHAMEGDGECFETLVSFSNLAEEIHGSTLLPVTPCSGCLVEQTFQCDAYNSQSNPPGEGPPRYLFLSIFLI